MTADIPGRRDQTRSRPSWLTTALVGGVIGLLGFLLIAGRAMPANPSQPPGPQSSSEIRQETPTVSGQGPNNRVIANFDAPVLGVPTGAITISTDFDGRITALDLDSGVVTRTSIRTGSFVTVDGQLLVQTGCGAWRAVVIPEYTLGDHVIECGSYQPIEQRGADVVFFAGAGRDGFRDVVMADGQGDVVAAALAEVKSWPYSTDGRLIESGPAGVLWADCKTLMDCDVWLGTPNQARVSRYAIKSLDGEFLARMNNSASRAVFFLDDEILRIVTLETGHAREIENPGIAWSTATWSPDGLWLFDPEGSQVVALNTLNGRTVRFDGVPGDVSPGWVAVIEHP